MYKRQVLSRRPYIRIAGDVFPREVVRSRFLKINSDHLEYVCDCIDKNVTKVNNIKAYLLAALYNAPATMDSYYRAEVNLSLIHILPYIHSIAGGYLHPVAKLCLSCQIAVEPYQTP